jgi:sec-independent protein translocase protein TatB
MIPPAVTGPGRFAAIIESMNLGFTEMAFIFFLALIFFGPRKLPEIARQIGRFMAEVKRASNQFQLQIDEEVRKLEDEERALKAKEEPKVEVIPPPAPEENSIQPPAAPVIAPPHGVTANAAGMHPEPAESAPAAKQEQQV